MTTKRLPNQANVKQIKIENSREWEAEAARMTRWEFARMEKFIEDIVFFSVNYPEQKYDYACAKLDFCQWWRKTKLAR